MLFRLFVFLLLSNVCFSASRLEKDTIKNCQFTYTIQLKESIVMCPYLGPTMIREFNKLDPCHIEKDNKKETIIFDLDTIYTDKFIYRILLDRVGVPEWTIDNIKIE